MINLLSDIHKKEVTRAYWIRLAHTVLLVTFLIFFLGFFLLIPSFVLTLHNEQTQRAEITRVRGTAEFQENKELAESLMDVRSQLNLFTTEQTSRIAQDIMAPVITYSADDNAGITIREFVYEQTNENSEAPTLRVQGTARTRDDVLAMIDTMQAQEIYTTANVPITQLAQNTDIAFMLSITINEDISYE